MARTPVKNDHDQTIGHIEHLDHGKQQALNARFQVIGYYDPAADLTRDWNHHIVGRGNQLMALINRAR